jgi:hypothetical protein
MVLVNEVERDSKRSKASRTQPTFSVLDQVVKIASLGRSAATVGYVRRFRQRRRHEAERFDFTLRAIGGGNQQRSGGVVLVAGLE